MVHKAVDQVVRGALEELMYTGSTAHGIHLHWLCLQSFETAFDPDLGSSSSSRKGKDAVLGP